jgi:putative endonuclease
LQESNRENWLLYVLVCHDGTLYTGITNDLQKRLYAHNTGKGAKYTRSRIPCEVLASCPMPNRSTSLKAEYAFKKLSRKQKLEAIEIGISSLFPEYLDTNKNERDGNGN